MARNTVVIGAHAEDVFAVLLDATAYPRWVIGARRLREVDDGWPAPGSRFHHAVGIGPFELRDSTRVLACEPPERLALEARFRPAGIAEITITVSPRGAGAVVDMEEHPVGAAATGIRGRVFDAVVQIRNTLSLRRLRRLAERRVVRPHVS